MKTNPPATGGGGGGGGVSSVSGATPLSSSGGATPQISMTGLSGWGTPGQVPAVNPGANGFVWSSAGGGAGDVVGPASSVDNRLAAFNGVTGKLLKDAGLATYSQLQNVSVNARLLGRGASGAPASMQELSVGSGLTFSGTTLNTVFTPSSTDNLVNKYIGDPTDFIYQGDSSFAGARVFPRMDSASNWTSNNTVLRVWEIGWEYDTGKAKLGDGVTGWNTLTYFITTGGGGGGAGTVTNVTADLPLLSSGGGVTPNISIAGLNSFGAVGQAPRVAAGGSTMEWYTPAAGGTVTNVTGTLPLSSTGGATPAVSMTGLSGWGVAGQYARINASGNAFEWATPAGSGGTLLPPTELVGAGPFNITQADHTNRHVWCNTTAGTNTVLVFNIAGTSGAENGGLVTVFNSGLGTISASGLIDLPSPNYKLTIGPRECFIALYDGPTAKYWSLTQLLPSDRWSRGEPSIYAYPSYSGVSLTVLGLTATVIDASTAASVSAGSSTAYEYRPKLRYNTELAAANRMAGVRGSTPGVTSPFMMPSTSFNSGFTVRCQGAVADANANGQFGMGLYRNGTINPQWTGSLGTNVQPSAMTDCFMLAADQNDANMQIMWNGSSGPCNKIDLGSAFPANTDKIDMYDELWDIRSINGVIYPRYWVTNLTTGVLASGLLPTTDIPAAGVQMGFMFARGSADNATTGSIHIGGIWSGSYIR